MRTGIILISLFVCTSVWATDFTGMWTGHGLFETRSQGSNPSQVELTIKQTADSFKIKECYNFKKDDVIWHWCSTSDLRIVGTDLLQQDFIIGTMSEDLIIIDYNFNGEVTHGRIEILPNGLMNYSLESTNAAGPVEKKEGYDLKN